MGYDVNRFESKVSDEFICTICHDVLEDPLVTPACEHIFCGDCIRGWLANGPTNATPSCPNDRQPASDESLKAPLRSFRNLLLGLNIRCSFLYCGTYVKLANLEDHENVCIYNPINMEKEFNCPQNCGALIKVQTRDKHNCVAYLKKELSLLETQWNADGERIRALEGENTKMKQKLATERAKYEEKLLNLQNEIKTTQETLSAYFTRQLEEAQEEICRLKGQAAVSISNEVGRHSANSSGPRGKAPSPPKNPLNASQSIDTALLVDFQVNDSMLQTTRNRLSNSRFYSESNSNLNGTVRSTGSAESGREGSSSVVRTVQNLFNKLPTIPLPRLPPPKPPKPTSPTGLANSGNGHSSSDSSFFGPGTSGNGNNSPPGGAHEGHLEILREMCKKGKILQVMALVNRRHFYPANEYYKAVSTKRGAHSFALSYEIRLLEFIEPYITADARILDIGSGLGFITVCLAQLAKTVVGVEHVKELYSRSREIVDKHYSELVDQNRVHFVKEDGRYGLSRLGPYDLILIEPLVRGGVPDILFSQLKPGGCLVACVKSETRVGLYKMTLNERKKQVRQTLCDDGTYLAAHQKDTLCDIKNQEMSFFSKPFKNF